MNSPETTNPQQTPPGVPSGGEAVPATFNSTAFAGAMPIPLEAAELNGDKSIVFQDEPTAPRDDQIVFAEDSTQVRSGVSKELATQKASKVHFALGDRSPGMEQLTHMFENGTEGTLRTTLATQENSQADKIRNDLIREKAAAGVPVNQQDLLAVSGLAQWVPKTSPDTILEQKYGDAVVNAAQNLGTGVKNPIGLGFRENPERTANQTEIGAKLLARQEIFKSVLHDVEGMVKGQSWGGYAVDFAKSLVPLYGTVKLGWGNAASSSYLSGSVINDTVNHFNRMPLNELPLKLREYLFGIAKDNPQLAREVAEAMLSYTKSQQFLGNAFSVFDAATFPGVGTAVKAAGRATGVIAETAARGIAKGTETAAEKALKDIVAANADETPNLSRMLNGMGDPVRAAEVRAHSRAAEIFTGADPSGTAKELIDQVPDIFRIERIVTGGSISLSENFTNRLVENLRGHAERIAVATSNLVKVARAPEEVYTKTIQQEAQNLQEQVVRGGIPEDTVLGISWVRPEDTSLNVGFISVNIGKSTGELFGSRSEAFRAAITEHKMAPASYRVVEQQGIGFYLSVFKHIDETTLSFRAALAADPKSQVKPSLANTFLGWLRSADDRVPEFQIGNRLAAVHARSVLEKSLYDAVKDIGVMSKKETAELSAVMKKDKMDVDPGWTARYAGEEPERGMFRQTVQDFEAVFHEIHQTFPTEQQTKAYFTYRQLNDWDWVRRNMGVYRDRTRMGYQTATLHDMSVDPLTGKSLNHKETFSVKVVETLSYSTQHDASILIHRMGKEPERLHLKGLALNPTKQAEVDKLIKEEGFKIVLVTNPSRPPMGGRLGADTVNFIITKDIELRPLDLKQIPYRPGWHTEYPQGFFVKQPKIRTAGGEIIEYAADGTATRTSPIRSIYEGDTAIFGFTTRAEARKYSEAMEAARKVLISNGDLGAHLSRSPLPFSEASFKKLFEGSIDSSGKEVPAKLQKDSPFLHTSSGKTTTDDHPNFSKDFPGFEDTVRSPWNLENNVDKKFLGQRDNALWTVDEIGSELNPIHKLTNAEEIDPLLSLTRSMSNIIRSAHFSDYKISHVEGWVQQFGHLLDVDKQSLLANPAHYLHNGTFVQANAANRDMVEAAKSSKRALLELLGTQSELGARIDTVRMKLLDSIYESDSNSIIKGGQAAAQKWSRSLLLNADNDPISLARKIAFHPNIGLYNPYQLLQNAMTSANAVAIAGPVHGFSGMAAALPMRHILANENLLNWYASKMTSFGWKPEWFKESFQELKKSGKWLIEGEASLIDDIADPKILVTRMGKFLDGGLVFFKEGERFTRLTAWNAAYREWRTANPLGIINDTIRRELMARSDLLSANMTRASSAAWQQGLFAAPAQFLSYHARLAEQMLGKRLTWQEKARVFAVNSALYGIPIGVFGSSGFGAALGGMYPAHEKFQEYFLNNNIPMDSMSMQAMSGGMINVMAKLITGQNTDAASKVGPGGGHLLKTIFEDDEKFTKILFGASGSGLGNIWKSLEPVTKFILSPIRSSDEDFPLRPEDAIGVLRNVKSIDSALQVYYAMNFQKQFAKNGQLLGDTTTGQMLFQALTGGQPRATTDMYLKQGMLKDRGDMVRKVMDTVSKDADSMYNALIAGDVTTAEMYQKRIAVYVKGGDLTVAEQSKLSAEVLKKGRGKIDKINWDFLTKAPASKAPGRLERATEQ